MTFQELNLPEQIQRAVGELGFEEATPVQAQTIPLILEGRDIIGHSQTGTGKTAAFGIPAILKVEPKIRTTQVLILCPTRELAIQACEEIRKFAKFTHGIKTVPIYGGQPIDRQIKLLKQGAHIVIGTPGRVMDHMRRHTLKFANLKLIVLDEADEMLNMGFREDIETILKDVPEERQTLLFSATMSKDILKIVKNYQKNPEHIKIVPKELTIPAIKQVYYEVPRGGKLDALCLVIDKINPRLTIVFCNTKRQVDELAGELQSRGYMADGIHGDMKQDARMQVLKRFKSGKIDILVATDVAARGIDVDGIDVVFNYDIPQDLEYYVHRIGRTGRAGNSGLAVTFAIGHNQLREIREIQKFTHSRMELQALPTDNEINDNHMQKFVEDVKKIIQKGHLDEYTKAVDILLDTGYTSTEIAAAMAKMLLEKKIRVKVTKAEAVIPAKTADGMTRLTIDIGRNNKITAGHIVAAVAEDGKIPGEQIGAIKVLQSHSYVEVPKQLASQIITNMGRTKIKGKRVHVKKA